VLLAGLGVAGVLGFFKFRAWKANQAELVTLANAGATLSGSGQRSLILQQIGNYRVLSMLGEGGMAEVYSAVPIETMDIKAAVAIKVINKESREKGASMDRFQREIEVSQGLNHPGIVEVKEWGWHGDRLYLAMELVEGQELRELLPDIRRDWGKIGDILSQLMVAVNFAHQQGVYHRDLKPENVMITSDGKVKVMDFGLAKTIDSKTLTKTGTCMGTPKYIAPEAISGKDVDDRADQYTLGVMAYEMIVGQVPFDGDEVFHLLYSHAALPPPPPSMVVEGMPQAIDDVLLRMLSKIPEERYRDVEEARVELLKALQAVS
jgi:serine/threonine protein kinase